MLVALPFVDEFIAQSDVYPLIPWSSDLGAQATIAGFYAAFNAGAPEAVMAFFTEESEITNHPFDTVNRGGPLTGLTAIDGVLEEEYGFWEVVTPYTVGNIEVAGDTATWDTVAGPGTDAPVCTEGHQAVVRGGQIITWTFGSQKLCTGN